MINSLRKGGEFMSDEEYREVNNNYFRAVEDMEKIENELRSLVVMIDTLCMGLVQEKIESQVIDCLKCVGVIARDIRKSAEEKWLERFELVDMDRIEEA